MATIRDIARLSGYSVSTVSRVVNQQKYVSQTAKKKVLQVITQLDYVPNDIARDLSSGQTKNIGVVLPYTKHPYFTQILNGVMDAAFSSNYRIVILPSAYDEALELSYLEQLKRKAYRAIIFTSHGVSLNQLVSFTKYGQIVCCENPNRSDISAVYSERETAYYAAFTWLKSQQYQSVAFLFSRSVTISPTSSLTLKVYQQIYQNYPKSELIKTTVTTFQEGYQAASELVSQGSDIECIFTNGDDVAAGVRQYYLDHGLNVPMLIGQENQLSGFLLNLPTIDHHLEQLGKLAFDLAISPKIKQLTVTSEFITR